MKDHYEVRVTSRAGLSGFLIKKEDIEDWPVARENEELLSRKPHYFGFESFLRAHTWLYYKKNVMVAGGGGAGRELLKHKWSLNQKHCRNTKVQMHSSPHPIFSGQEYLLKYSLPLPPSTLFTFVQVLSFCQCSRQKKKLSLQGNALGSFQLELFSDPKSSS